MNNDFFLLSFFAPLGLGQVCWKLFKQNHHEEKSFHACKFQLCFNDKKARVKKKLFVLSFERIEVFLFARLRDQTKFITCKTDF